MKRMITLFGIAVMAALAFTAIASAETTKILPEPTSGAPLTDAITQSTAGHFLSINGLEVKCKKGSGSETWTSANNGAAEMTYRECTSALSSTCTGKSLTSGEIQAKGEVHFWLALQMESSGAKLVGALVFLIKPAAEFVCENKTKTIKNEVVWQENSCIAAKDLNVNSLVSTDDEEFAEWTSGETSILSVLPAGTTNEISCLPTDRLNAGASELFAIASNLEVCGYEKGGSEITVELMN
jgi:hypothetical protein